MSPRTTHCNHWCVRQHRRAPPLVGRSSCPKADAGTVLRRPQIECRRGRDDCHYPNTKTVSAMTDINVLIIVGLRAASVNRELAKVAADSSADGIALKMFDSLTDLPRYSETFENRGTPSSVGALAVPARQPDPRARAGRVVTEWPHGGHTSLPDGGVVRLDFELGRWVATHYSPDMTVLRLRRGNFIDMRALAADWSAHACRCASPSEVRGEERSTPVPAPGVDHPESGAA